MTSNRLILLFLGIVFLVIVILSSNKIGLTLRGWFGKYIPTSFQLAGASVSPTPTVIPTKAPLPTSAPVQNTKQTPFTASKSTPSTQIPATGPEDIVWLFLGSGLVGGVVLSKLARISETKSG